MSKTVRLSSRALIDRLSSFERWQRISHRVAWETPPLSRGKRRDDQRTRPFSTALAHRKERIRVTRSSPHPSVDEFPGHLSQRARIEATKKLPTTCPGCGAPSQTLDPSVPGYFDLTATRNEKFGGGPSKKRDARAARLEEDEVFQQALKRLGDTLPLDNEHDVQRTATTSSVLPICDRCHMLRYQSQGQSIVHPSLESIQAMIEDSPHKYNHIYHVVDAADFPMSLVPNLTNALHLPRLRTQNRRSKSIRFLRGRTADVTFIITRSDLLAPKKEQVDTLLPYLKEVLRDALGKTGKNVRLGNVRCVSAKRGWWTRTVKEEIWHRGGAGWMVGKVNVGKSALYEVVFPKGRNQETNVNVDRLRDAAQRSAMMQSVHAARSPQDSEREDILQASPEPYQDMRIEGEQGVEDGPEEDVLFDEDSESLLPPARQETAYPEMPTVSNLPGTTASPIRIPFGNGRGELIDLPGIHRSLLDSHVRDEFHSDMIMKSRVVPERHTLKPGQSLILGGFIRITPKLKPGEELIFLAYPFMPLALEPHVTATYKAIAIQTGVHGELSEGKRGEAYTGTVQSIATEHAKSRMQSAGTFALSWDATKKRAGPLTARHAAGLKSAQLPFIVYSADILIEGVGWVEMTCQMRKRPAEDALSNFAPKEVFPEVEVFTPEGKFIGIRRPMNGFVLGGPKKMPAHKRRPRPRQSIGLKKRQMSSQKARSESSM